MILKLFTKKNCPKCPAAKKVVKSLLTMLHRDGGTGGKKPKLEKFDIDTVDGMAEAAFYMVMSTPTILLCNDGGKEIASWRGEVPSLRDLKAKIKN